MTHDDTGDDITNLPFAFAFGMSLGYVLLAVGVFDPSPFGALADGLAYGMTHTAVWWVLFG